MAASVGAKSDTWQGFSDKDLQNRYSVESNETITNPTSPRVVSLNTGRPKKTLGSKILAAKRISGDVTMTSADGFPSPDQRLMATQQEYANEQRSNVGSPQQQLQQQQNGAAHDQQEQQQLQNSVRNAHHISPDVIPNVQIIANPVSFGSESELTTRPRSAVDQTVASDQTISNDPELKDSPHTEETIHRTNLEAFDQRRRQLEEENAMRKRVLSQAIVARKERTQQEAQVLAHVQGQLAQLDASLSADVAILRNEIEQATLEFSESEKRYLKAEREFVESKMLLYQRLERKEKLTEHLCYIIEENEARKARKLDELMRELDLMSMAECAIGDGVAPSVFDDSGFEDGTQGQRRRSVADQPVNNHAPEPRALPPICRTVSEPDMTSQIGYDDPLRGAYELV